MNSMLLADGYSIGESNVYIFTSTSIFSNNSLQILSLPSQPVTQVHNCFLSFPTQLQHQIHFPNHQIDRPSLLISSRRYSRRPQLHRHTILHPRYCISLIAFLDSPLVRITHPGTNPFFPSPINRYQHIDKQSRECRPAAVSKSIQPSF
jgi:hypothetical protein